MIAWIIIIIGTHYGTVDRPSPINYATFAQCHEILAMMPATPGKVYKCATVVVPQRVIEVQK